MSLIIHFPIKQLKPSIVPDGWQGASVNSDQYQASLGAQRGHSALPGMALTKIFILFSFSSIMLQFDPDHWYSCSVCTLYCVLWTSCTYKPLDCDTVKCYDVLFWFWRFIQLYLLGQCVTEVDQKELQLVSGEPQPQSQVPCVMLTGNGNIYINHSNLYSAVAPQHNTTTTSYQPSIY